MPSKHHQLETDTHYLQLRPCRTSLWRQPCLEQKKISPGRSLWHQVPGNQTFDSADPATWYTTSLDVGQKAVVDLALAGMSDTLKALTPGFQNIDSNSVAGDADYRLAFATALSTNFAAKVLLFVPKLTPLVSILVENVPTPLTTKSSKSVRPLTSAFPLISNPEAVSSALTTAFPVTSMPALASKLPTTSTCPSAFIRNLSALFVES